MAIEDIRACQELYIDRQVTAPHATSDTLGGTESLSCELNSLKTERNFQERRIGDLLFETSVFLVGRNTQHRKVEMSTEPNRGHEFSLFRNFTSQRLEEHVVLFPLTSHLEFAVPFVFATLPRQ